MQAPRNPALCPERTRLSWPPSAQSPFARSGCYPRRGGLEGRLEGRYPLVVARTGSCARPSPSPRLRFGRCARGLCRLSPVPAGRWPFPTLSLRSLRRRSDPYPAALPGCACPLLRQGHRPHPTGDGFGARVYPHTATSVGTQFRGCSHSITFGLLRLLGPQVAPTAADKLPGGRAFHTTHRPAGYPDRDVAPLHARHGQLAWLDSHQLDRSLVGYSLLPWVLASNRCSGQGCRMCGRGSHRSARRDIRSQFT
jgi:hypothetical protein